MISTSSLQPCSSSPRMPRGNRDCLRNRFFWVFQGRSSCFHITDYLDVFSDIGSGLLHAKFRRFGEVLSAWQCKKDCMSKNAQNSASWFPPISHKLRRIRYPVVFSDADKWGSIYANLAIYKILNQLSRIQIMQNEALGCGIWSWLPLVYLDDNGDIVSIFLNDAVTVQFPQMHVR